MNEERVAKMEREISAIRERNARVEADKAWEVSSFRAGVLACVTFLFTLLALLLINDEYPFRNALIVTCAFLLSVQSFPLIKKWWLAKGRGLEAKNGAV